MRLKKDETELELASVHCLIVTAKVSQLSSPKNDWAGKML